jgi:hypothetical protein
MRRRADVIERVAGDQRQRGLGGCFEHADIVRVHDLQRLHLIFERPAQRGEDDFVVHADVSQRPEKRVAMRGHRNVARPARHWRRRQVTRGAGKYAVIVALVNHYADSQPRNLQTAHKIVPVQPGRSRHRSYRRRSFLFLTQPAAEDVTLIGLIHHGAGAAPDVPIEKRETSDEEDRFGNPPPEAPHFFASAPLV